MRLSAATSSGWAILCLGAGTAICIAPAKVFFFVSESLVPYARLYAAGWAAVGFVAIQTRVLIRSPRFDARRAARILLAFCATIPLATFILAELKYYNLRMYADMANNLEIMWRATHGLGLTSPMFERAHTGEHWFAGHFAPIAYLLAQPFRVLPDPEYLNALMALVIPTAAVPVYLYARDRLGEEAAPWVAASVLLYPTIQFLGLYDFGFLQLCIPVLCWAFYAAHRVWTSGFLALCLAALTIREEVGLTVGLLGVYAAFFRGMRAAGAAVAVAGIVYSACAIAVWIPSFRAGAGLLYSGHYGEFGATVGEVARSLLTRPWSALPVIFTPIKLANASVYLLPLMMTPLVGFPVVAIAALNVATSFLAAPLTIYSFMLYYLSPSLPFLFMSSVDGLKRLRERGMKRPEVSMAACALACAVLFGPSPLSLSFWFKGYRLGEFHSTNFHWSNYVDFAHARAGRRIAALVPKDAVVSAEQPYLPLLYDRRKALIFPELPDEVQYALIDRKHPYKSGYLETYLDFRARPEHYYGMLKRGWMEIAREDGVALYRRL